MQSRIAKIAILVCICILQGVDGTLLMTFRGCKKKQKGQEKYDFAKSKKNEEKKHFTTYHLV